MSSSPRYLLAGKAMGLVRTDSLSSVDLVKDDLYVGTTVP